MSQKLILFYALLALSLVLVPFSAQAQAPIPEVYKDTYAQTLSSTTYVDHYGYHKWASAATFHQSTWDATDDMTIYNSTSYNFHPIAATAIYGWASAPVWPSRFKIRYVSSASSAFVRIQPGTCNSGSPICHSATNPYNANPRHAKWYNYSYILYGTMSGKSDLYKSVAFAHEFGHALGRGEAYAPGGACSSVYSSSIMDTWNNATSTHCDNIDNPTGWDDTTNASFWDTGNYTWYASNSVGSTYLEAWKDYAWNEGSVLQEWYYWNGSNYVSFYSKTGPVVDSGSHNDVNNVYAAIDKYPSFAIVPSAYGVPNHSFIKLCTTPIMAGITGSRICSPGTQHNY